MQRYITTPPIQQNLTRVPLPTFQSELACTIGLTLSLLTCRKEKKNISDLIYHLPPPMIVIIMIFILV